MTHETPVGGTVRPCASAEQQPDPVPPADIRDSFYAFIDGRNEHHHAEAVSEPVMLRGFWDGLMRFDGLVWHVRRDSRGVWKMAGQPVEDKTHA